MNKNEKARFVVATTERAAETAACSGAAISSSHSTTPCRRSPLVSDLLHAGAENALTLRELVQLTGEDERSIRRRIQQERKDGKLILSDCQHGYFLPAGESDVRRFIGSMSRRAKEIVAVSRAAEDALLKLTGQETMRGW